MLVRMWSKGNTAALLMGVQTSTANLDTSMVSQKIENQYTLRSIIPLVDKYPEDA